MANKSSESMSVRFLINTKTQRIVYAEAGKEFVDFLFSFLCMPMGAVLKLLHTYKSSRKIGSVSNLYESMEKLPSEFMNTDKSQLLSPKFVSACTNDTLRIEGGNFYVCAGMGNYSHHYAHSTDSTTHNISTNSTDECVSGNPINRLVQLRQNTNVNQATGRRKSAAEKTSGYMKELFTFIITDDLKITGSSTITSIMLLNQLNINSLTGLRERNAIVDRNKALEILEASLVSTTVLNDVFGDELSKAGKASVTE